VDKSDIKRLILRGIIIGAIAGLSIRFVLKGSTESSWLEALPPLGMICGALFTWRIGQELYKNNELKDEQDHADKQV